MSNNPIIKTVGCNVYLTTSSNRRKYSKLSSASGLDTTNKMWDWGPNGAGGLGDNTTTSHSTPVAVCGSHVFYEISLTIGHHATAIDYQGKLWSWGYNSYGQLGNNNISDYCTPIAVCGAHTFCKISTAEYFSCSIDKNGRAWAWGINEYGNIGDGTITSRSTPVAVCGAHTFCKISSGVSYQYT